MFDKSNEQKIFLVIKKKISVQNSLPLGQRETNWLLNIKLNFLLLYHSRNLQRGTVTLLMSCLKTNERKLNTRCVAIVNGVSTSHISQC